MRNAVVSAFLMALLTLSSFAQADGHSELEEANKTLTQMVETLTADRKRLSDRLRRAIAVSKSKNAELSSATEERDVLRNRLRRAIAVSKSKNGELSSATEERDVLRNRLRRAIAVSKSKNSAIEERDVLRNRLRRAIAVSKSKNSELSSATAERDVLRNRLRRAIANAKTTKADLQNQLAGGNSEQSDWAATMNSLLESSVGGVQGPRVTTGSDNSVRVQVGNSGLFTTGGVALSRSGASLLSQIARQLTRKDSTVTVIGHTDNVPVGENSRFGSNEVLSFARATSTLQYLSSQGVPVERLSAAGYGANYPIASNDTVDGRRQNRRVEIILRAP